MKVPDVVFDALIVVIAIAAMWKVFHP